MSTSPTITTAFKQQFHDGYMDALQQVRLQLERQGLRDTRIQQVLKQVAAS